MRLWAELRRVVKTNAAVVLCAAPPFDKMLAASNLGEYRYDWVWEKGNATGHLNAKRQPLRAHEYLLVFYREPPTYNPQKTTGHKPVNNFYTRHSDQTMVQLTPLVPEAARRTISALCAQVQQRQATR